MKVCLRFGVLTSLALLIALGLASCGSSNSNVTSGTPVVASFAYLLDNSFVASDPLSHTHSVSSHRHTGSPLRTHTPRELAPTSTGVDIGAGTVDIHIHDTTTGVDTQLTGNGTTLNQSYAFSNVQLSNDGTKLVFSAANTEGYVQIYLADSKLQTITQLTGLVSPDVTAEHYDAALSADGTTVAFDDGAGNLWTMPAAGEPKPRFLSRATGAAASIPPSRQTARASCSKVNRTRVTRT